MLLTSSRPCVLHSVWLTGVLPQAGDALFIPEGWWHQVDSQGATTAVMLLVALGVCQKPAVPYAPVLPAPWCTLFTGLPPAQPGHACLVADP